LPAVKPKGHDLALKERGIELKIECYPPGAGLAFDLAGQQGLRPKVLLAAALVRSGIIDPLARIEEVIPAVVFDADGRIQSAAAQQAEFVTAD